MLAKNFISIGWLKDENLYDRNTVLSLLLDNLQNPPILPQNMYEQVAFLALKNITIH